MNEVVYNSNFKEVIQLAKNKRLFIGSGNPNSKILFIGKEAAIDKEKSAGQYEEEYSKNTIDWNLNCSTNKQLNDVDNWFIKDRKPIFNSLYPYKGQINKVERRDKSGKIISGHCGTSKTWYNYQKIIDSIYFNGVPSEFINFHELSFCSELNQETGSYSKDVPKNKRAASIELRKELFNSNFFRDFPIIILAVGHYVRDFKIDLENVFQINFNEDLSQKYSERLQNEYINIHFDNLEKPTRLLIHTNQLSMVSNELINRLGMICKEFSNKII
ncbi:hypothetical protein NYQ10_17450 [Flavobacterium johnsoniae]|uniref:hypothetical protein n=1 Tax=Flavobacterium johnsoniae TaxID=986 RepID=UPI0025B0458B|nr:hypothetical protein [Flavobacterium johnsoniae]WJS93874.1 hypothetical protein NYQ10_17450 [Flavobacterium johnsoniae]